MDSAANRTALAPIRHLYPFRSHFLAIDGMRMHYLDEGRGDPVLMLHGNPTWSFYYRELVKALSGQYRVVVPDHIGCGLSDKPSAKHYSYRLQQRVADLARLMAHLGLEERITLIVHDWGGMIGLAYALQKPERISRLIVFNTAGFLPPGGKALPLRLKLVRNIVPLAVPAVLGMNLFAQCALYMASRKGLAPDVKTGLLLPYNSWRNRIATLKFVQDIPLQAQDPSYALVHYVDSHLERMAGVPTLICWGGQDFVFDKSYLGEWRRRWPHARLHLFQKAGHYVLEDAPRKVVACVRTFLHNNPL